ncbi:ArsA-related P-loop ATPase [soil metagenome]|nr:ArsA family ATPase [Euzebyaceae bacterium]
MDPSNLLDPRLLIVTGKGGVGKSTVAAALAVAGARTGRRTCLVEVEGRQTFSRLFDTSAWDFTEREFRPGIFGLSIDPEASLVEYLDMFYGARRLSKLVVGSTAVEFATTAAPGIKDVLLIGKVKEMERRRDGDGRFHYDLVVVDAPPTGRIVNFLRAPDATTEMVNVGPIRSQAQSLVDMLLDGRRTHLQLVTLLEEMPVQETVDSVAALRGLGVTLGPVVVNRVLTERFDAEGRKALTDDLEPAELAALLTDAGLDVGEDAAAALGQLGYSHLSRLGLQERMRDELRRRVTLPTIELPYVYGAEFGADAVGVLARKFEEAVT